MDIWEEKRCCIAYLANLYIATNDFSPSCVETDKYASTVCVNFILGIPKYMFHKKDGYSCVKLYVKLYVQLCLVQQMVYSNM